MKVLMLPHLRHFRSEESGIKRVVEAYFEHLPKYGVDLVREDQSADVVAVHAGNSKYCDVAHCHGLYWTADYPASSWEWSVNKSVIENLRTAKQITVPSDWVAETIRRDMRKQPHVIPHGIDWEHWQHDTPSQGYVLWNKNRQSDVCDPRPVTKLARRFSKIHFLSTFVTEDKPGNLAELGLIPHDQMRLAVQGAAVYLSTVKETFCIGALEAMAASVPVLGYAHGGVMGLVEHGVNGYLAQPGNLDDLADGLTYCLKHREVLGANGREIARAYTWEKACEQVAGVYRLAQQSWDSKVTVVIPSYNYADKVGRAIESVLNQTHDNLELFVVDDGSTDETPLVVSGFNDDRLTYVYQDNQGVANARNNGIARGTGRYVCCLDADDMVEPDFLEACVGRMEQDNGLGIAYTRLRYILPDGKTGVSPWPGEWDFDKQLKRQNQVPTCCVFRRDMWEQLGGYKPRYCPMGAGSEDAEFWTRSGAFGWRAELVTEKPLFVYSWKSGRVSGSENYSEVDWLAWHPWASDDQHPFASHAKPRRFSHPVRQYDEPAISVIIPVGPGHEEQVKDALDSLEAQTFRKWEAVVVWDNLANVPENLATAYPYVRWLMLEGRGAGAARNVGAEMARAPLLLFLDADDWLYPEALDKMLAEWGANPSCVYSDFVGKAFGVDPAGLSPNIEILHESNDEWVLGYKAPEYDWQRAQRQPEDQPWIWCNITTLVPRTWHQEVGGFDEVMDSWEDVDYWYRLARIGKPFVRIPEPLLVYRFYSGSRRDQGHRDHRALISYMREKYKEIKTMPCSGCGGRRKTAPSTAFSSRRVVAPVTSGLNDDDFEECVYASPNRAQQRVIGQAGFTERIEPLHMVMGRDGLWRIEYGWRQPGDVFLVHRRDAELAPNLFQKIQHQAPVIAEPPPEPKPIIVEQEQEEEIQVQVDDWRPTVAQTATVKDGNGKLDLQTLPGITPGIAKQLEADGIETAAQLLALGVGGLQGYNGVGPIKARMITEAVEAWSLQS